MLPARQIGWISRTCERLDLPLTGNGEARCPQSGEFYVLQDGVCRPADVPIGTPSSADAWRGLDGVDAGTAAGADRGIGTVIDPNPGTARG